MFCGAKLRSFALRNMREGENLKERGDLSAAKTSLSLWFLPSHPRPAPNKNKPLEKG